jgi:hypothetical protein
MNPDGTPIVASTTPPEDVTPAWAQSLIDQNADMATRLAAFEEKIAAPVVDEPVTPQYEEVWTPKSWSDVDARAEEKAKDIVEQTLAQREAAAKAESDAQAAAANEIDSMLDNQVNELIKTNALPAITDDNDPNDPGKLAQRELYGFALSLGTADLKTSYTVLDNLHKAGKQYDFVKGEIVDKNPASLGAQSPVGSSNSGASGAGPAKMDYKTLHGQSLDQLASRFMSN